MAMFKDANQVRLQLKMKLSIYSWYANSRVQTESDGYSIVVGVRQLDNKVRKLVPQVIDGVSVKTELA